MAFGAPAAEVSERIRDTLSREDSASQADGGLSFQKSTHAASTRLAQRRSFVAPSALSALSGAKMGLPRRAKA